MKITKKLGLVFLSLLLFAVAGCVSVMDRTGKILDGSAFEEKRISRYRAREKDGAAFDMELLHVENKIGQRSLVISQKIFPAVQIRATEPNAQGIIHITSIDYLSGNTSGWNQYRFDLSGTGSCVLGDTQAVFSLNYDIEAIQISSGKIRFNDSTLIGSAAAENLRNRADRIEVLTEWMKDLDDSVQELDRKAFKEYWKPFLLPETCPRNKRPAEWQQPGDTFVKSEDIRWNTGYTERVFPEVLWQVRNSGTLLRDWEEAFEWIYLIYEWEMFVGMFSAEITLNRIN